MSYIYNDKHGGCQLCGIIKLVAYGAILLALAFVIRFLLKFFNINSFGSLKTIANDIMSRKRSFTSAIFQVDEHSNNHGGALVASVLKAHKVQEVFTLCGGHISPILTACEKLGIRVIDTRHEVTAVFAADAVARLRQTIGVAVVTSGPGITNTITALKNAQMAESPILLLGGGSPTLLKGCGALQDINQMVLVSPLCKYSARIRRVCEIVPTLRTAIHQAQSGTPGPVFVELPVDVLYSYVDVINEAGISKNNSGIGYFINSFIYAYISWQFSAAFQPCDITPLVIAVPKPQENDVYRAAELISKAKRPLFIIGSQAVLLPVKPEDTAALIESLKIPAYLSGMARGLLGKDSPIQMRHNRRDAVHKADLIILAGTVCDFRLSYGRIFPPGTKIIAINRSKSQLKKNHGIFWRGAVLIQADVGFTLFEILKSLKQLGYEGASIEWFAQLREADDSKDLSIEKKSMDTPADGHYNPLKVLRALDQAFPDDTIYVADGGDFVGTAAYIARPRGPLRWLDPGAFGTLGMGAGFALGAKIVFPDSPVVILYGDGAAGYSIIEFDTFVRSKLPVIAVIGNDACWTQIARDQIPRFNSNVACDLAFSNYEKIGEGLGARGVIFEKDDGSNNCASFRYAVREAITASKQGKSSVLNVLIGKSDFRSGSISL